MRRVELRLGRQKLIASLRVEAGSDLAGGQPEEFVVGDLRRGGCRVSYSEGGHRYKIIENCITAYQKVCGWVIIAFLAGSDDGRVMRGRALLDNIVLDYGIATPW